MIEVGEKFKWIGHCRKGSKEIGVVTFIFLVVFCILSAGEVIYIFEPEGNIDLINVGLICTGVARVIFFLTNMIVLVGCKKTFFYLVTLDPIALPMAMAVYAYIVFLNSIFYISSMDMVGMGTLTLVFTTYAGCHRALVAEAKWRQWQIIIYKLGLVAATGIYVVWGIRYIFPGISWTNGKDENLDEGIKEFMILYVVASADFLIKLYEALCDLDKTSDLQVQIENCSKIISMEEEL